MHKKYLLLIHFGIILFLFLAPLLAYAADNQDAAFNGFINDDTSGDSFQEAIEIEDICDYSRCQNRGCALAVLERTLFQQECYYVSNQYGVRGKDWDIAGSDEINYYTFAQDRYYDDLAIEVFATGERITLHFDISSPVRTFKERFE